MELAERVADGLASDAEREAASNGQHVLHHRTGWALVPDPFAAAHFGSESMANFAVMRYKPNKRHAVWLSERTAQTVLIRCIFGNPFRPVTFSPEWRTSTTVAIAAQIDESRDLSAMPILADALQDAGCDTDVLDHCRGPGAHVRGCWVVDLLLGKA